MLRSRKRGRIRAGSVVAFAGLAIVAAGCGSSSSSSSASAPASSGSSSSSASSSSQASSGALTLGTATSSDGTYLTGASGRTLYLWAADAGGKSACSGQCAKVWPPLLASSMPSVSGAVKASDVGLVTRSGGEKQVTYKGHPLYYFIEDKGVGKATGQGSNSFGAKWWLVAPTGTAITKGASSSSSSSPSKSAGYGTSSSSSTASSGGGWG